MRANIVLHSKITRKNFRKNPSVRLTSPAKNELIRLSKCILEANNKELTQKLDMNQRKHREDVIDWFKGIKEKHPHKFVIFDINDFYPSLQIYQSFQ